MKKFLSVCFAVCLIGQAAVAQVPVITADPKDTSICRGTRVTLTVTASNNPTTYIWQRLVNLHRNTWYTIQPGDFEYSGATTNALTLLSETFGDYYSLGTGIRYKCIAVNSDGASAPSAIAIVKVSIPRPDLRISGDTPFCKQGPIRFDAGVNLNVDSVTWTYSGSGVVIHTEHTKNETGTDSLMTMDVSDNATDGILTAMDSNTCGIYGPATFPVVFSPEGKTVAGVPGKEICSTTATSYIDTARAYTLGDKCADMLHVHFSGNTRYGFPVQSCIAMDSTVRSYNGTPYVQRHYNIENLDPENSITATVSLYYTQADFDNYNAVRGSNPALPADPTDADGISHLRVTHFHGTGTAPGTYTGTTGEIDPDDDKIVWNVAASRWEVTFDIDGFSGFYVSTGSMIPLPLTLTNFDGRVTEKGNLLNWTTTMEQNTAWFEIQRHDANNAFATIAKLPAGGNSQLPLYYSYTDNGAFNDTLSYRLKMVDLDGKFTYSRIIQLAPVITGGYVLRVSPNPSHMPQTVTIIAPAAGVATLALADLSGRQLFRRQVVLSKGANPVASKDIDRLPAGAYLLTLLANGQRQTIKLVRY